MILIHSLRVQWLLLNHRADQRSSVASFPVVRAVGRPDSMLLSPCRKLDTTPSPRGFSVLEDGASLFQTLSLENSDIKG